jgi:asparagine N-glycosylation enzyme membrane subunit Stt3
MISNYSIDSTDIQIIVLGVEILCYLYLPFIEKAQKVFNISIVVFAVLVLLLILINVPVQLALILIDNYCCC